MAGSFKQFALGAVSGRDRTATATAARLAAGMIEPFYSAAMMLRNAGYDRGIFKVNSLSRPTISVGNITTGGTGKTPVVRWLADQMVRRGHHPAVLLRGYGSPANQISDEAQLLAAALAIPVHANPSRVRGAGTVLRQHPEVDLFILDDAFQHRRVKRDFNLVLISATNPFGHGRVLPRGLLREPLRGLGRADAFLITRQSLVTPEQLQAIEDRLQQHHAEIPVYLCDHHHAGVSLPQTTPSSEKKSLTSDDLASEKVFLIAGIGDPASFAAQIARTGAQIVGTKWFDDHHAFTSADIAPIRDSVLVVTTEKDWVKLKSIWPSHRRIGVVELAIRFVPDDEKRLLAQMSNAISENAPPRGTAPVDR